jgi:hypothetical protein
MWAGGIMFKQATKRTEKEAKNKDKNFAPSMSLNSSWCERKAVPVHTV